ncbi:MAG: HPr-rel-A system PqqD family peptide chaperone [Lacibacter sp.]|jgi:PqqD family protein of HPr-rel-A system
MKVRIKRSVAISDSGFVFDASTGDSYTLNQVGLDILQRIREGKSDSEITAELEERYDVDRDTLERYFYDFLVSLKQMQLIEDHVEA